MSIFWQLGIRIGEKFLLFAALWWAFIMLLPLDTFGSSVGYDTMEKVASETVWGLFFFALATGHFVGLLTGHKKLIKANCMISVVVWLFVATMLVMSNPLSTGTGMYFLVAYVAASVYSRIDAGDWL